MMPRMTGQRNGRVIKEKALHSKLISNNFVYNILTSFCFLLFPSTAEGLTRKNMSDVSGWQTFLQALGYFLKMFFGSAALGTLTGLISALISLDCDERARVRRVRFTPPSPAFSCGPLRGPVFV